MARMVSACGVLCSACPAYLAASKGIAYQRRVADAWRRIYHLNEKPANISCGGCLGPDDQVFHTCRRCQARRCFRSKGLEGCAECARTRCTDLARAQALWDGVPDLAATLSRADFAAYARPYCGHRRRLAAARAARRTRESGR
jgi:hypothetical protein